MGKQFENVLHDMWVEALFNGGYRLALGKDLLNFSYLKGDFTLTSGKTLDFYVDAKKTVLNADGSFCVGMNFCDVISKYNRTAKRPIEVVAGMTLGADPLVTATSIIGFLRGTNLQQIIIRKEAKGHGTGQYLEKGGRVPAGASVALLEDVMTTAGTLLKAISRLKAEGFSVNLIIIALDREEGGRENLAKNGYTNVHSIYTRTQLLELESALQNSEEKEGR